jgi:hypothetical protein
MTKSRVSACCLVDTKSFIPGLVSEWGCSSIYVFNWESFVGHSHGFAKMREQSTWCHGVLVIMISSWELVTMRILSASNLKWFFCFCCFQISVKCLHFKAWCQVDLGQLVLCDSGYLKVQILLTIFCIGPKFTGFRAWTHMIWFWEEQVYAVVGCSAVMGFWT